MDGRQSKGGKSANEWRNEKRREKGEGMEKKRIDERRMSPPTSPSSTC